MFGWEGLYEVSSLGRILSLQRKTWVNTRADPHWRTRKARILKGRNSAAGYPVVTLTRLDGTQANRYTHGLVCEAFHGPRAAGKEVRHLDGDTSNARASNLAWGTHSENMRDRIKHGTSRPGSKCHLSVLTDASAREVRSSDEPYSVLAKRFGVTTQTVYNIKKGKTWRHLDD